MFMFIEGESVQKLVLLVSLLFSFRGFCASITVEPFNMQFELDDSYEVHGQVELACRYEKLIISDSAKYETFYQKPTPLDVEYLPGKDFQKVIIKLPNRIYFEYKNWFKFGKECRASFSIDFKHKKYVIGYGQNPKGHIKFSLKKGFYDYLEGDQIYDPTKIGEYLDNTSYTIEEHALSSTFMLLKIKKDGLEAPTTPWVIKVKINPETGKPYIKKNIHDALFYVGAR